MSAPHPFFRRFFPGEEDDAYLAYHRLLSIRLPKQGRVLDLGCGDHQTLARYRDANREIWGADFHRHPRNVTPAWFRPLPASGAIPFADSSFDVVACSWVLEHVSAPQQFLAEVHRVLRPGGWFVALTINGQHYAAWIRRAFAWLPHHVAQRLVFWLYRRPNEDTFPTCYRLNSTRQLRCASKQSGLELAKVHRVANQGYFAFFHPLWRLAVMADRCLDRIDPVLGRVYFIAVWRRPETATVPLAAREAA